ncbi:transposase [Lewinella sp. W8]|uniref:IS110 family transposase n=1 Tax=Lewinella sp. W8 TaxID=2528208 RepID=UPI00106760B3|nr:transposase [Lewinella sp. W8]MTB49779.1 transposase [Lewinella sp. W8]
MSVVKQSIGVDVSKDDFYVRILFQFQGSTEVRKHRGVKKFSNTNSGFIKLHEWLKKYTVQDAPMVIAMEATGVYHEALAYFLFEHGYFVSVQLSTKVNAFAKSHNLHNKTDVSDAEIIARLVSERKLVAWRPPTKSIRRLRALTRQYQAITESKTVTQNQLHAMEHSALVDDQVCMRYREIIALFKRQLKQIELEIRQLARQDELLDNVLRLLMTIPGVALKTAAVIAAETGCFQLFDSRAQLVKFSGMDVVERQSGSSVRGRSSISKRGNSRIRRALFMPSLSYVKDDGVFGQLYQRVYQRTMIKKKGLIAVQRKLLVVMYAIVKNGTAYDPRLHQRRCQKEVGKPKLAYRDSIN